MIVKYFADKPIAFIVFLFYNEKRLF